MTSFYQGSIGAEFQISADGTGTYNAQELQRLFLTQLDGNNMLGTSTLRVAPNTTFFGGRINIKPVLSLSRNCMGIVTRWKKNLKKERRQELECREHNWKKLKRRIYHGNIQLHICLLRDGSKYCYCNLVSEFFTVIYIVWWYIFKINF